MTVRELRRLLSTVEASRQDEAVYISTENGLLCRIDRVADARWFGENPERPVLLYMGENKDFT